MILGASYTESNMATLFVRFRRVFRKMVDGRGERCPCCNRPISYEILGSAYVPRYHACNTLRKRRSGRVIQQVVDDGENDPADEDMAEGARIERGFAMMELRDALDFGGVIDG